MGKPHTLIVLGMMGQTPFAGVAWQVLHFLEGIRRQGHEVYYVEDTGEWAYDPEQNTVTSDCRYAVEFIARMMKWCGLPGHWAYRSTPQGGRVLGLSKSELADLYRRADALINLTASTRLHDEQLDVPVRIYLETDPVLPQIKVAQGDAFMIEMLAAHTHHFTYGENLGAPDCGVPVGRFQYFSTRQPIVLDWWSTSSSPSGRFTTVANWRQKNKDIEWNGEVYTWSKHHEFLKFLDAPRRSGQSFELALSIKDDEEEVIRLLNSHGWLVCNALALSKDILAYRDYILSSRGEFTVAKDQNVRLCSGWFSDRSACYLAAGRPVVTQDTGFSCVLPIGEGLFAFQTMDDILAAIDSINSDYERHSRAARAIAEQYFKAETVLAKVLDQLGL
jgi:hypothetical protein